MHCNDSKKLRADDEAKSQCGKKFAQGGLHVRENDVVDASMRVVA
jgi:hypothetical protein